MTLLPRASTTPSSTCYSLTGLKSPFDTLTYTPCNTTAVENGQHSACCASTDLCLTNGLCKYNAPSSAPPFNEYWRVGCTDPTYQDAACPKQCANIDRDGSPTHLVFQCTDPGKWCCALGNVADYKNRGSMNTSCCSIDSLAFSGQEAMVYTTAQIMLDVVTATQTQSSTGTISGTAARVLASSTSVSTSVPSPESGTSAPSSTTTLAGTSSGKSNIATGVGLGVGIPCAAAVLIALIYLILQYRRKKDNRTHHALPNMSSPHNAQTLPHLSHDTRTQPHSTTSTTILPKATSTTRLKSLFFWRSKSKTRGEQLNEEDLRQTNPHAYWTEAHGKEIAVEMDTERAPAEIWTPTKTGQTSDENAEADVDRRTWDFKYGLTPTLESPSPSRPDTAWVNGRDEDIYGDGYGERGWGKEYKSGAYR